MAIRKHGNNIATTLNGAITNSATSMTLTSTTGLPSIGAGETFRLTLVSGSTVEIVEVTDDASSPTFTITRGMEGTTGVAWSNGATVRFNATANSYDRKQDQVASTGEVIDFGAATSFEIPNGTAPVVNADGEIAVDTSVADFSHGVIKYYSGEEMAVVAVPLAELTTPTNGDIVAYNSTADEFQLVQPSVSDGDKGDITVASSGTAWTIDTPASATVATDDKVLIKDTSASDVMKYVTAQSVRDLVPGSGTLTSAQLATSLTDETGSGAAVFATSPTLVTPALGTPSSGDLSSCVLNAYSCQVFTSSGTWTRPTGIRKIVVEVVGGGGGGGGTTTTGSGEANGGGGGGGGYTRKIIDVTALSSETVTVGAGGVGNSAANGSNGGTSSFGSHCSATGGTGGDGRNRTTGNSVVAGAAGGAGSGGDLNINGSGGGPGIVLGGVGLYLMSGGSSILGATTTAGTFNATGSAGSLYGAGGAGAGTSNGTAQAGGTGASGVVFIWEFK